jgi:hypothetical protein
MALFGGDPPHHRTRVEKVIARGTLVFERQR